MATRHPITGDNWTSKQEADFNKAEFEKNLALFESMTPKELGATGPKHAGMGTLFSPNRWQAYIDWLVKAGMEAEAKALEEAVVEKTESKILPKELYWDEDATDEEIEADIKEYEEGGPYVESDPADALIDSRNQTRGLKGERDADGNLMQGPEDITVKASIKDKDGNWVKTDEWLAKETAQNAAKREALQASIAEKKARLGEMEADTTDAETEVDVEDEDSIENWMANFESMSDEMFESIKFEDLAQYGENAQDAYTEVKLTKDKQNDLELEDSMTIAEDERQAMEAEADDQALEDEVLDAESERVMMEADADADKLDAAYEANTFPMMGMSDEDKGMFTFKKTESKDDKNIQAGIGVITQDTGMNEEQARQLMTKLKGICG